MHPGGREDPSCEGCQDDAYNEEPDAVANAFANNDKVLANALAANDKELDAVANALANHDEELAAATALAATKNKVDKV